MIAHFEAASIGRALCESDTWLSNKVINTRFRKLLASPESDAWQVFLFPAKNQGSGANKKEQEERAESLAILWQLRHNFTHNSGVLTGSDAMKLRVLSKRSVAKDQILAPTEDDIRYVKRFLSESAENVNEIVGARLATLLTDIYKDSPMLVDPVTKAQELANLFDIQVAVATAAAVPQ